MCFTFYIPLYICVLGLNFSDTFLFSILHFILKGCFLKPNIDFVLKQHRTSPLWGFNRDTHCALCDCTVQWLSYILEILSQRYQIPEIFKDQESQGSMIQKNLRAKWSKIPNIPKIENPMDIQSHWSINYSTSANMSKQIVYLMVR